MFFTLPWRALWPLGRSRPAHLRTGAQGEEIARRYLRSLGYSVHGRNVRAGRGEIDLIAFDPVDRTLVFVEVKARSRASEDFLPAHNAGHKKWRRLRRAIGIWVARNTYDGGYRIDLISVIDGRVTDHAIGIGSIS